MPVKLKIDPEFKAVCRKLTEDEYNGLEADIKEYGCNDPILLWDGFIVDGHNRYEICRKHGIDFRTLSLRFDSRADVLLYMIDHQLARRNLHELDKVALLEAKRPILEKQARESQVANLKQGDKSPVVVNLPQREEKGRVRDQLATEAGVSGKTYDNLKTVVMKGSDELKEAVREKKIGASKAAEIAKLPKEDQPEFIEKAIEQKKVSASERGSGEKKIRLTKQELEIVPIRAEQYAGFAISQLERIDLKDPTAIKAFDLVITWINERKSQVC